MSMQQNPGPPDPPHHSGERDQQDELDQSDHAQLARAPAPPLTHGVSKIQHSRTGLGRETEAVRMAEAGGPVISPKKITAFGREKRHEERWSRTPNTNGTGAIHVKTFHSKLTDDALVFMDQTINEWLDAHPQYEVKFVNASVGILTGKLKEPHLICQVWV